MAGLHHGARLHSDDLGEPVDNLAAFIERFQTATLHIEVGEQGSNLRYVSIGTTSASDIAVDRLIPNHTSQSWGASHNSNSPTGTSLETNRPSGALWFTLTRSLVR